MCHGCEGMRSTQTMPRGNVNTTTCLFRADDARIQVPRLHGSIQLFYGSATSRATAHHSLTHSLTQLINPYQSHNPHPISQVRTIILSRARPPDRPGDRHQLEPSRAPLVSNLLQIFPVLHVLGGCMSTCRG